MWRRMLMFAHCKKFINCDLGNWNDKSADTKKQQIYVCPDFYSFIIWFGVEMKSSIKHCTNLNYWTNDCSVLKNLLFSRLLLVTCLGLGRRPSSLSPESNLVAGKLRSPCPHLNYASKPSTSLVMLQS